MDQIGSLDPWTARNERRIHLIEKSHIEGLSSEEACELDLLKREVYDHIKLVDSRSTDFLDEIDSRLDSKERAQS